jgi:quercetin 2,3-dioxygenase
MTGYFRPSAERGHVDAGWLDSRHSFSFGGYHDPAHMGFGVLRVINEDRVQPGQGFGTHGHRDMEILTYVLEGALAHQDDLGNGSVIGPGDVQRMSAGTGVRHSEYNHSATEAVRFLQIWILPAITGARPGYEQRHFDPDDLTNVLRPIASPSGTGAVTLNQDVTVHAGRLQPGRPVTHSTGVNRKLWLQVIEGAVSVTGAGGRHELGAGDGLGLDAAGRIALTASEAAHVLLFDLPGRHP